jgi:threonine dehydrogenase-like Zn-dependent dehydrogenase
MGLDVRNAHFRPEATVMAGMRRAVRLIESGAVDTTPFMTHTFRLADIDEAFRTAASKPEGFVKAVVTSA